MERFVLACLASDCLWGNLCSFWVPISSFMSGWKHGAGGQDGRVTWKYWDWKEGESVIYSTIIAVLWYMKLDQMMQKGAQRSQHVCIALAGTCEGLQWKPVHPLLLAPRWVKVYIWQQMRILISRMVWHIVKWEENSLKLMAGWRIK